MQSVGTSGGAGTTFAAMGALGLAPTQKAIAAPAFATFSEGQYMNCGPARLAQWMVTVDHCRELDVPIEVFTNINADAYIYNESKGVKPGHPIRYRTVPSDAYGYVSELLAKATSQGALDKRLTSADKQRLLAFPEDWGSIGGASKGYRNVGRCAAL
jgi:monoamine oxidase